ncbi:twin-arginine translocase TatA/TatE family subunit [Aureibaculum algae]|uniref:Sec-independent protein translocase protein TatA n=2 Tax=Aureibaculum TaxID=2706948 RepID=A0A5B7TZA3_9FLAO|nr:MULTISPECIES: twin-arginine translocase TatA/TatE family subunit [Aureibaculum]MBJ2173899.1 twin-arginine translocase TatA/TatE family subunit [Aureibaculum flavum]QCX40724.1 twin-arginine translocase TatA/TatE family subunit [Aureibaculum algae]
MYFLFISGGEIFVVVVIVLMLFGADKIPGIAQGLGKGMRQLKDATNDIKREITETAEKQGIDTNLAKDLKKDMKSIQDNIKGNIDDVTGPIKRNL